MKTSDQINEIGQAMAKAQSIMKPALKDGLNPHFKSKYSDITSVWEALRIPMTSNGLTVWQDITTGEKTVSVSTRIVHSSGQWVEFGPLCIPVTKVDAQGFGSATSYAKRYALCAAVGIVSDDDDDDAEKAVDRSKAFASPPLPFKPKQEMAKPAEKEEPPKPVKADYEDMKLLGELMAKVDSGLKKSVEDFIASFKLPSINDLPKATCLKMIKKMQGALAEKERPLEELPF